MNGHAGESRDLAVGDRIVGPPCVVTVEWVDGPHAHGRCETCTGRHIIDRARYEGGRGPWRPEHIGSNVEQAKP